MTDRQTHTQLIANGNTEKSLQLLAVDFPESHEVIMLNGQWRVLQSNKMKGILGGGEESRQYNLITANLLDLLATLDFSMVAPSIGENAHNESFAPTPPTVPVSGPKQVFISYSHADEKDKDELKKHLKMMQRQGKIIIWDDRAIDLGTEFHDEIISKLRAAHIIILLVSADFLDSDFCYDIELKEAMERHERREAKVVPVILEKCQWKEAPFSKLAAAPRDARPVSDFPLANDAWFEVASMIQRLVEAK